MSCYFRHLKDIFAEAGIELTPASRKQADQAIHEFVGIPYKNCPRTWKNLKHDILTNKQKRQELVEKLQQAIPK